MINVEIRETENEFSIEVTGHAGYDVIGKDIVCAGITALAQAFQISVKEERADRGCIMKEGYFAVNCNKNKSVESYVKMFKAGCLYIRDWFPENVDVKINKL